MILKMAEARRDGEAEEEERRREERREKKNDDEIVAWALEAARHGLTLANNGMDWEDIRDLLRDQAGRNRAMELELLQPVLPTERQGKQGWQELEATAAGPKGEGEWEMDGELGLWERGQPVGSWSEEVERTGGGAFPDSICAKWHQINR